MRRQISCVFTVMLLGGVPAAAQSTAPAPTAPPVLPASGHRLFVALNGGYQASSLTFNDRHSQPLLGETASWTADYERQAGPSFDIGGGVRIWRNLVASVGSSRFTESRPAGLSAEIPHPFFFDRSRSLTGMSPALQHTERAIHVAAGWTIPATPRVQVMFFGGPSFFSIARDLVEDVEYSESYPYDEAVYQGTSVRRVSQARTGFNAGADLSFFVTETIGFGGGVRFSRAQARLASPATGESIAFEAGGTQATIGLRLRFAAAR